MKIDLKEHQDRQVVSMDQVYEVIKEILLREQKFSRKQEFFWVMGLSTNSQIEYVELVALGRLNAVNILARDVFSYAVESRCARVVLVHNHPSGNVLPSAQDIFVTEKMVEAAMLLDITIEDHLIISEEKYRSFAHEIKVFYREREKRRAKRPLIYDFTDLAGLGKDQDIS